MGMKIEFIQLARVGKSLPFSRQIIIFNPVAWVGPGLDNAYPFHGK
jgi:hypothetical protein